MVIYTLINRIVLLSLAIFSILIVLFFLKVTDAIDHYRLLELGLTDRSHENPPPPLQLIK